MIMTSKPCQLMYRPDAFRDNRLACIGVTIIPHHYPTLIKIKRENFIFNQLATGHISYCQSSNHYMQLNFFDQPGTNGGLPSDIIDYRPGIFSPGESARLLDIFIREMPWQQRIVHMYGKQILTPRLTVWAADPQTNYPLSGYEANPIEWTPELLLIKSRIEALAGISFNGVLLNYYRDGSDSVAWHTDNDGIPGKNRLVASVSFGQARIFDFRKMMDHSVKYSIALENGSYLFMKGEFQDKWQHRIAKSTKPMKPRINLTFRVLK
jgi:alkylated DNA repair dioxygenase AlkB